MRSLCLCSIALAGALSACVEPTVVRVVDGREIAGRFVSPEAYALYARGAEAEARGSLKEARAEYAAAAERDDHNAEIWTRIGAVSCALGEIPDARSAFERAADSAPDYEPLYRERARCVLDHQPSAPADLVERAYQDAARALELDPDSEEAALLYARAAEARGEHARAESALRELVVRAPGRVAGWRALRSFAERRGDRAAAARAAQALRTLGADEADSPGMAARSGAAAALDEVDAAVTREAIDEARSASKRARLPPAELAVRAAALGRGAFAKAQAELVFGADPSSTSAAIALAVASDLLHDDQGVLRALSRTEELTTPPSPLASLLFAELLSRRVDRDAARAFLSSVSRPAEGSDALLGAVWTRVSKALGP